jgi:hypothetical protein
LATSREFAPRALEPRIRVRADVLGEGSGRLLCRLCECWFRDGSMAGVCGSESEKDDGDRDGGGEDERGDRVGVGVAVCKRGVQRGACGLVAGRGGGDGR